MGVKKDYDYITIPASAWQRLHAWYGGGPQFPRRVITVGLLSQSRVDIYPIRLMCCLDEEQREIGYEFFHHYFSRNDRIKEIRFRLATFKNYPPHKCEIVMLDNEGNKKKFDKSEIDTSLMDLDLEEDTKVVLETPNFEGNEYSMGGSGYSSSWRPVKLKNQVGEPLTRGANGFNNLGKKKIQKIKNQKKKIKKIKILTFKIFFFKEILVL